MKTITIQEAHKLTDRGVKVKLREITGILEDHGFSHEEACSIVSGAMNLGVVSNDRARRRREMKPAKD